MLTWAKANPQLLRRQHLPRSDMLPGAAMPSSTEHSVVTIAELTKTSSVGIFHVEAEMTLSNDLQQFCVLECSGCRQKKGTKDIQEFDCPKCQKKTTLVPRCAFQLDLVDGTGTATAIISGELAEKMLARTASEIFHTTCTLRQLLPITDAQQALQDRLFQVQLRKSTWKRGNMAQASLSIIAFKEVENTDPSGENERSNKRAKSETQGHEKTKKATIEEDPSVTGASTELPPSNSQL